MKVQELREIIRLIDQSSISELTYENNGSSITLKKQVDSGKQPLKAEQNVTTNEVMQETKVPQTEIPTVRVEKNETIPSEVSEEGITNIISPMVGTFYRKPSPESDNYVEVGDSITENSIVCIVEAMKLFNEIEAETTGEIVDILVGDGELVEYGQPLFKVKQN